MPVAGRKFRTAEAKIDRQRQYAPREALEAVKGAAFAKFNESVDVAVHGTGKSIRVLVLAQADKAKEAEAAGADFVGAEYLEKIKGGWLECDVIIATPDMMGQVGPLGRVLGPRGLMPNPKSGTVTMDVERAVREVKAGKIEFRVDKTGNLHAPVGKVSFELDHLDENLRTFMDAVVRAKPSASKGTYVRNVTVSSSMGPGVHIDPAVYR